jgi:hypothetical protein
MYPYKLLLRETVLIPNTLRNKGLYCGILDVVAYFKIGSKEIDRKVVN